MYGICHTSNVRATTIGHAASVLAPKGGLENGMIVVVGDLATGESDIRNISAVVPAEIEAKRIGIIASPEIVPGDDTLMNRSLGAFHIEEGGIADEYDLVIGDQFEISESLIALGDGVKDLVKDAKYLTTSGMKYQAVKELPAQGVALKINRVFDATAPRMFNKGLEYRLIHLTVERV
ncbi:MAG: hypothetical protein RSA91_01035 [Bacilli bacterium]